LKWEAFRRLGKCVYKIVYKIGTVVNSVNEPARYLQQPELPIYTLITATLRDSSHRMDVVPNWS